MSKSFTIHDLPKDERPRERLIKFGDRHLQSKGLRDKLLK
jgi:DNA repair protein RadC